MTGGAPSTGRRRYTQIGKGARAAGRASRQALLVIDVQQGIVPAGRPESRKVVERVDDLAERLRGRQVPVILVMHRGVGGHPLHPTEPGHAIHRDFRIRPDDVIVAKRWCDPFLGTGLERTLIDMAVDEVIVTGCTTEFCIDATVRSALARGYRVVVPVDGHTTSDRPPLSATDVIRHHNAIWASYTSPAGPARLTTCAAIAAAGTVA